MPLVTRFDTPGSLRDAPTGSRFYDAWHEYLEQSMRDDVPVGGGGFYDASKTNITRIADHHLTWMGFPRDVLITAFRDDRPGAFAAAEARTVQNEYFEWHVAKTPAGKIKKITFVTETPEYWERLAQYERATVVRLYRSLVDAAAALTPAQVEAIVFPGGTYNRYNALNAVDGIVHYIQSINTLNAAIGLVQGSLSSSGRDNYEMPQSPDTNVDPRVALDIANLVRTPLMVTLRDPIGLYIAGWDDSGWTKPNGQPVGNYWRIVRGVRGAALRVEYEVPAGEGFVVGDIEIGGRRIEYGGQLAEHITVMVSGTAGRRGR